MLHGRLCSVIRNPHWAKLLEHSKKGEIEVHLSSIVVEEWRTHIRDELVTVILNVKSSIAALEKDWGKMFVLKVREAVPYVVANFPENDEEIYKELDKKSDEQIRKYIEEYKIKVLPPQKTHGARVWVKYFSWLPPFNIAHADRGRQSAD